MKLTKKQDRSWTTTIDLEEQLYKNSFKKLEKQKFWLDVNNKS